MLTHHFNRRGQHIQPRNQTPKKTKEEHSKRQYMALATHHLLQATGMFTEILLE